MTDIWVAIIGALAAIATALIGILPQLKTKPKGGKPGAPPPKPSYVRMLLVLLGGILAGAAIIVLLWRVNDERRWAGILQQQLDSYSEIVKRGLQDPTKTYVIPSIVMLVRIEESSAGSPPKRIRLYQGL